MIKLSKDKGKLCNWYQIPTDTETILNYRSCAPNQDKRIVIKRTVHIVFISTSNRKQIDKAMETTTAQ